MPPGGCTTIAWQTLVAFGIERLLHAQRTDVIARAASTVRVPLALELEREARASSPRGARDGRRRGDGRRRRGVAVIARV